MVVLCNGMLRSGSTWSFNVALELVKSYQPERKIFGFYNDNPAVLFAATRPRFSNLVIKSHTPDPSTYELCRTGAIKAIYTWRDPYDVIVSAMRMFGDSAEHWMAVLRNSLRLWSFHRAAGSACIVSYESIVHAPLASLNAIAAYLGIHIEPEEAHRIAQATSLEQVKGFSQQITDLAQERVVRKDGYVFDRRTLLHQNHIRDGRIGYGVGLLDSEHLSQIDALLQEEGFEFLCKPDARRLSDSQTRGCNDPIELRGIPPVPAPSQT